MAQHDRHYVALSAQERFSLLLEAMSRRDEVEADRVLYSCPRRSYSGPDIAFNGRVTMGLEIIALVCGDLRYRLGSLRVLLWAMASIEQCSTLHHINASMAFVEGVRCGQGLSQSPFFNTGSRAAADDEERLEDVRLPQDCGLRLNAVEEQARQASLSIRKLLLRAGIDIAGELICLWEAFGDFARSRLGLAPEKALEAVGFPQTEDLKDALKLYSQLKPDPQAADYYRDIFCGLWDRTFGDGR